MAHKRDAGALEGLRSYAADLVESAPPLDTASLHLLEGSPVPSRPHHLTAPLMAVVGVAAMLFFAEVGVAVVANSAVPGDQIYGIDLLVESALTTVGVPIDRPAERIDEAETLLARGDVDEAVRTARTGYRDMDHTISGITVLRLVQTETALASNPDPATEAAVKETLTDLIETTKQAGAIEASDVRAINDAAERVLRAAEANGDGAP